MKTGPILQLLKTDLEPSVSAVAKSGALCSITPLKDVKPQLVAFTDMQAVDISNALSRKVELQLHLNDAPKTIPLNTLEQQSAVLMDGVESHFLQDGCAARVWTINHKSSDIDEDSKLTVILKVKNGMIKAQNDEFQNINWSYHVAAGVFSSDRKIHVFDPTQDNQKSLTLPEWVKQFDTGNSNTLQFIIADAHAYPTQTLTTAEEVSKQAAKSTSLYQGRYNTIKSETNPINPRPVAPEMNWRFKPFHGSEVSFSFEPAVAHKMAMDGVKLRQDNLALVDLADGFLMRRLLENPKDAAEQAGKRPSKSLFELTAQNGTAQLSKNESLAMMNLFGLQTISIKQVPCVLDNPEHFSAL